VSRSLAVGFFPQGDKPEDLFGPWRWQQLSASWVWPA
jgi:hypothetical protein